jgi:hypothetical protein
MEKASAMQRKHRKRTDPDQFERFLEAARKRGVDESLEDFAVQFKKAITAEKKARLS